MLASILWPLGIGLGLSVAGLVFIAAIVVFLTPLAAIVGIRNGIRDFRSRSQGTVHEVGTDRPNDQAFTTVSPFVGPTPTNPASCRGRGHDAPPARGSRP
jgi:hypothetical protein